MTIWKVPVEGNGKDGRNVKKTKTKQKKNPKKLCLTPPSPQKNIEKRRGQEMGGRKDP